MELKGCFLLDLNKYPEKFQLTRFKLTPSVSINSFDVPPKLCQKKWHTVVQKNKVCLYHDRAINRVFSSCQIRVDIPVDSYFELVSLLTPLLFSKHTPFTKWELTELPRFSTTHYINLPIMLDKKSSKISWYTFNNIVCFLCQIIEVLLARGVRPSSAIRGIQNQKLPFVAMVPKEGDRNIASEFLDTMIAAIKPYNASVFLFFNPADIHHRYCLSSFSLNYCADHLNRLTLSICRAQADLKQHKADIISLVHYLPSKHSRVVIVYNFMIQQQSDREFNGWVISGTSHTGNFIYCKNLRIAEEPYDARLRIGDKIRISVAPEEINTALSHLSSLLLSSEIAIRSWKVSIIEKGEPEDR
ncbi:hypothetical protein D5018_16590 [Parashewanella curva]|uniref:Uncharacterized protein n=1 Tax=Parashewanella curva TaxID=2338552 RepID=A0A3L8PSZ9_9GAMM|nr:hypothetical protein [Parashewanella curva]RLV58557.1 hypothetical protein D5018_16590 [Parashewanella curva]